MNRCLSCMNNYEGQTFICPHCGYEQNTPPREAYHLMPGTILQGRYIVGKVLGYGGFGVTYIGFDAKLERKIAIKEFLPTTFATRLPGDTHLTVYNSNNANEQFGTGLNRFVEEAQTLASFNGIPGVVDIYDTFATNNTGYIVMQYLNGSDVKAVLNSQGAMPYEMAKDIIISICDTLMPIHAQNIIHRDISPDNIYITNNGEIKLLDFGAARYESAVNSKSLSVILKSGYAPEEQYRSKGEQGPWTDVYALAATFYKMLTGQTPPDSMERAIKDEIQEPTQFGVTMPQSAQNALMNALHVNKSDRTKSIYEFKMALLNDGTQRVVVKQKKQSSKVPLGAKITIAVCSVLLLALGAYASMGGFESDAEPETIVVGGTQLEEIEAAEDESITNVPDFTDMSLEDATAAAEDLGLSIVVDRKFITGDILEQAVIFDQEIAPGQTVDDGTIINVLLHVGDPINAMARGDIENIYGLEPTAAVELLEDYKNVMTAEDYERADGPMFKKYENREEIFGVDPFAEYYFVPQYIEVPSSAQEKDKAMAIVYAPPTADRPSGTYTLTVGTGVQDHSYGSMDAVEIFFDDSMYKMIILEAQVNGNEHNDALFTFNTMVSQDGGNTFESIGQIERYANTNYPSIFNFDYSNPALYSEELIGKELIFKVERTLVSTALPLDSYTIQTPIVINPYVSEITVSEITQLSFEEGQSQYNAGNIGFVYDNAYGTTNAYALTKQEFEEFYQTYKITGNFSAGAAYNVQQAYTGLFVECKVPGELYFMLGIDGGGITAVEFADSQDTITQEGNVIKLNLHKPHFVD